MILLPQYSRLPSKIKIHSNLYNHLIYIYPHNVSDLLEFNSKITSVKNKRQKRKKIATRSIEFKQILRQVSIGQHSHSYKIVCNIVR